ncbi:hypothetical protein HNY73_000146 [Argiope bruennichi]|uniref:Uncharacterized protein n=1 Tax=Argiope bruennichi TaxID=94029 RepID=A0A8T0FX30_ARGBR|nr:hypothetical protein HNY73_000146 [Argiope bruennichi]
MQDAMIRDIHFDQLAILDIIGDQTRYEIHLHLLIIQQDECSLIEYNFFVIKKGRSLHRATIFSIPHPSSTYVDNSGSRGKDLMSGINIHVILGQDLTR